MPAKRSPFPGMPTYTLEAILRQRTDDEFSLKLKVTLSAKNVRDKVDCEEGGQYLKTREDRRRNAVGFLQRQAKS